MTCVNTFRTITNSAYAVTGRVKRKSSALESIMDPWARVVIEYTEGRTLGGAKLL